MKKMLLCCVLMLGGALQVYAVNRNFTGEGTWTGGAEQRGVITSQLHIGWLSGIKIDYRVKFDNGERWQAQMIIQPRGGESCILLTLEKEILGECRGHEENVTVTLSFTQDKEQVEITVDFSSVEDSIGIIAKKTAEDGSTVIWHDKLSEVQDTSE